MGALIISIGFGAGVLYICFLGRTVREYELLVEAGCGLIATKRIVGRGPAASLTRKNAQTS